MQNTETLKQTTSDKPMLSTEQLAAILGVKSSSIRQELCRSGEYYGLRPMKLPNRFLRWPADSLEQLLKVEG